MQQTADRIPCFKAYDIRGRMPDELDPHMAYRIGRAYAEFLRPKRIVVGHDIRLSSTELNESLTKGLTDSGVDVYDIGMCGTEQIYFATFHKEMDGGIMITASHNPPDYNGMKLVREESRPISGDTGLREIEAMVARGSFPPPSKSGSVHKLDIQKEYIEHLLSYVDRSVLKPFKVVVNAGNGCAGPVIDLLEPHLPFNFIKIFHDPDGTFPHGVPNPLLPENRDVTIDAVRKHRADIGIAWDGDFDRCFLFDEDGSFIEGYYIVGLLAEAMLRRHSGAKIIHDPRLTWNTIEIVKKNGGIPIQSKTGHAFIKERMRAEDAVYGGEMSGHHYFKGFAYCDSGMIPWFSILETMSKTGKPLSELVGQRMKQFPVSGEINRRLQDPDAAIRRVESAFKGTALSVDYTDGVGMEFDRWRFNLRKSNTEPVLRLNVEAREDSDLMKQKTEKILELIDSV